MGRWIWNDTPASKPPPDLPHEIWCYVTPSGFVGIGSGPVDMWFTYPPEGCLFFRCFVSEWEAVER